MQRKQIQAISFIALLALMFILMCRIFLPFAGVILWSAFLYILMSPLYIRLLRRLSPAGRFYELRRHLLAGIFALMTVIIVAGALFFLGFKLIGQISHFIEDIKTFVNGNPDFFRTSETGVKIAETVKRLSLGAVDVSNMDIKKELLSLVAKYSATLVSLTRSLATDVSGFVMSLAFLSFSLFFFYADGVYLARVFVRAIPIETRNTRMLLKKFREVTKSLFLGFFLVAFYQAVAAFAIFNIFDVSGALLFSVLILFSSFVPIFGCALVWFPIGLSLLVARGMVPGVLFMAVCSVFISFLDNFLRPFFLHDRIKIHPLLIFFSILGGLQVFGVNGILLGPIVVILFFTIVDVMLEDEIQAPKPDAKIDGEPDDGGLSD